MTVVISIRRPFFKDVALTIELQNVRTVGRPRCEVATVHHIEIPVRTEGNGPGPPELGALSLLEKRSVTLEDLHTAVRAVSHIEAAFPIARDAVRGVEFAGPIAFAAPIEENSPVGGKTIRF